MVTLKFSEGSNARLFQGALDEQFPKLMLKATPSTLNDSDVTIFVPDGKEYEYNNEELTSVVTKLAFNYRAILIG